ncbi:hypothetical protein QUF90_25415 [Desulfococcaceae bacterium HSG9]|nr:hypothetical protein [Desulfococcaceae bacterium HSG9]
MDRTEICEVDKTILPQDAEFKSCDDVIVQEIKITTDNILYKKEIYYSKLERKTGYQHKAGHFVNSRGYPHK